MFLETVLEKCKHTITGSQMMSQLALVRRPNANLPGMQAVYDSGVGHGNTACETRLDDLTVLP